MSDRAVPLLLSIFPGFGVGGAQVRFAAIANHYGPAWRHAIVALNGDTACRERLVPGLDVSFPSIAFRKGNTVGNVFAFRRMLRELRPHTLITSNWGSIEWAMANAPPFGRPLTRHVHIEDGFGPEERSRQLRRRVWMRRMFLRHANVVVPSQLLRRIATNVWGLAPGRVRYVPNGIDLASFAGPRENLFPGEGPVIGTVAALRAEKNLGRLLHAFRQLSEDTPARLVIVGDGPERAGLEAQAARLGIADSVIFTGHVAQPQGLYRGFDLFALSSDTEQMPLSVLEAMAAGLPVAATDVGDVRDMVAAENAPLISWLDDTALASALRAVLRAPDLGRAIGLANRAKAERDYAQSGMFARYGEIFIG